MFEKIKETNLPDDLKLLPIPRGGLEEIFKTAPRYQETEYFDVGFAILQVMFFDSGTVMLSYSSKNDWMTSRLGSSIEFYINPNTRQVERFSFDEVAPYLAGKAVLHFFEILPVGFEILGSSGKTSETTMSGDSYQLYIRAMVDMYKQGRIEFQNTEKRRVAHEWFVLNSQGVYSDISKADTSNQLFEAIDQLLNQCNMALEKKLVSKVINFNELKNYFPNLPEKYNWDRQQIEIFGDNQCVLLPKLVFKKII